MALLPASWSHSFRAERTATSVQTTVSNDLASIASKAAPFAGALLAASAAPGCFMVATGLGFVLAQELTFVNSEIDEIWEAQEMTIQILTGLVAFVVLHLSPILAALYAGQRFGAWARETGPLTIK